MDKQKLKIGDIVYCSHPYIDTEYGYRFEKYSINKRLIHTTFGKEYIINNISTTSDMLRKIDTERIEIKNDFGIYQWYDLSRFNDIKMIRRMKLQRLKNIL
jgi:hypothetical protein